MERHAPLGPSELAQLEGVQRPTVTRAVARLVAYVLVDRLRATPEGRRVLSALRQRKTAYLARRLERLDPEEPAVLARAGDLLKRMLAVDDA
ncbi:MAG: hypothetical protein ACRDM7_21150 [Thermoleophilaceae bacterium]